MSPQSDGPDLSSYRSRGGKKSGPPADEDVRDPIDPPASEAKPDPLDMTDVQLNVKVTRRARRRLDALNNAQPGRRKVIRDVVEQLIDQAYEQLPTADKLPEDRRRNSP
jgi:hypothetical protein